MLSRRIRITVAAQTHVPQADDWGQNAEIISCSGLNGSRINVVVGFINRAENALTFTPIRKRLCQRKVGKKSVGFVFAINKQNVRNRVNITRKSVNVTVGKAYPNPTFNSSSAFSMPRATPADLPEKPFVFAVSDNLDLSAKPCTQEAVPFNASPAERPRSAPAVKRLETMFITRFITAAD